MKLSRSTLETHPFVLNWASLKNLHSSVSARFSQVYISAKCADKLDREFASLQELEEFGNPSRAAIQELTITGRELERDQRFSISLCNHRKLNVRISLDADEENATVLNDLATDSVESLRPWYSWVARADWYWLVLGGWLGTQFVLIALKLALAGDKVVTFSGGGPMNARELLEFTFIGFVPVAVGIALNLVRDKFFPIGTFSIGQGENRHSSAEVIRTVLIAGLAVSIVTSVALSWFS
jgi:hypothetical protein